MAATRPSSLILLTVLCLGACSEPSSQVDDDGEPIVTEEEATSAGDDGRPPADDGGLDGGVDASVDASDPGDDGGPGEDSGPPDASDTADASDSDFPSEVIVGGDRPARLLIPASYDGVTQFPLIIGIHGYTSSPENFDGWWRLSDRVDPDGFLLLLPEGTPEASMGGHRFWNASGACCNRYGSDVDDVAYLLGILDEVAGSFVVDPDRVYLAGHSNGGFMSYRLACEASERFAAVVSLAGNMLIHEADCPAPSPLSVLQVHGDADRLVLYAGDPDRGVYAECPEGYPGAVETAERWATHDGCDLGTTQTGAPIDIEVTIPGIETTVLRYETSCAPGTTVELWTIQGGGHLPRFHPDWAERIVGWLLARSR